MDEFMAFNNASVSIERQRIPIAMIILRTYESLKMRFKEFKRIIAKM